MLGTYITGSTTSRMFAVSLLSPRLAIGISGATKVHPASLT
jgi:hypothetical protein